MPLPHSPSLRPPTHPAAAPQATEELSKVADRQKKKADEANEAVLGAISDANSLTGESSQKAEAVTKARLEGAKKQTEAVDAQLDEASKLIEQGKTDK